MFPALSDQNQQNLFSQSSDGDHDGGAARLLSCVQHHIPLWLRQSESVGGNLPLWNVPERIRKWSVVAGDVWCWWIRRYRTRHGRRIKVRWLWIVTMVLRDHNRHWTPPWQSWGWPPARCLVNRRRTPPPEAEAHRGVIGYRSVVRGDIVLWVRVIVLLVPASSRSTSAVDFYANVQWELSRARAVFNRLC